MLTHAKNSTCLLHKSHPRCSNHIGQWIFGLHMDLLVQQAELGQPVWQEQLEQRAGQGPQVERELQGQRVVYMNQLNWKQQLMQTIQSIHM